MKRAVRIGLFVAALVFLAFTFVNAAWLAPEPVGRPGLIAHAAPGGKIGTCDTLPGAARYPVLPDNSLRAIIDARQLGAAIIEVAIAADGRVAPAKCAASYGPRPTLAQVVQTAQPKPLLFTFTGSDPRAADRLTADLEAIGRDPVASRDAFYAVAEAGPIARMRTLAPGAWVFSAERARACTAAYRTAGWFGILPDACKGGTMMIPLDRQKSMGGWPDRLLERMSDAGGHVIVTGPEASGDGPTGDPRGLDLPEQFGEIPDSFNGFIWVDDLWNLGPALFPSRDNRRAAEQDAGEAAVKARRAAR